jgi:hypothetical protein
MTSDKSLAMESKIMTGDVEVEIWVQMIVRVAAR